MTSNISTKLAITLGVLLSTMTTTSLAAANPLRGNPFINSSSYLQHDHGGQDDDKDQDQDCDHDQDKDQDKDDDKGKYDGDNGNQNGDKGDHDDDKDQDNKCVSRPTMRVDCRYHNDKGDDKAQEHGGVKFCYASAVYTPEADEEHGTVNYTNMQLGVGCDQQTIYNNSARVHTETVSERISPPTAAFPGVEIFPQGALLKTGTYESVLDIRAGRISGVCYVHEM